MSRSKDESSGSMLPLPMQFLAAWLSVWFARAPGRCPSLASSSRERHWRRPEASMQGLATHENHEWEPRVKASQGRR